MSALSHLTLSNKTRTARLTHPERRREKLLAMLRHQAELVKAELRGAEYVAIYRKWALDDRGIRRQFERQRRVRPWYWESGDGQWHINVRYGAAIVSLAPGKTSVTVGRKEQLPAVFEALMQATEDGELDSAIAAVIKSTKEAADQKGTRIRRR